MTLRKATAEVAFAADITLPGVLHLAVRRSDIGHGRVVSADAADARNLPGVVTVMTAEDTGGVLDPELRFVGDRAAVVAAEDPDIARRATERIRLAVQPLPLVLDPDVARTDPGRVAARIAARAGDVDEALSRADQLIEGTWTVSFAPDVALEPRIALTWLDQDRRLVIRTSAESPFRVRGHVADRLGLPAARIRVVRPLVSGGLQGRAEIPVEDLCALVTLRTGRPARLALTTEEEMTIVPGRPPQRIHVRLALRDGSVSALALRLLVDLGAHAEDAETLVRSAARQALSLYATPSFHIEAEAVLTNRPPTSTRHGADDDAAFAVESAMEEAARRLGEDPVEFRRRHLRRTGGSREVPLELGEAPGAATALDALLRTGVQRTHWAQRTRGERRLDPVRRGLGAGLARLAAGASDRTGAAATLRLLEDGSFSLSAAPSAAGATDETVFAAAAASILGVPPRRVVLAAADTDSAPFETGDRAPALFAAGRAVERAAELARQQIREAGAAALESDPERTELVAGEVRSEDGRVVSLSAIGTAALEAGQPLVATAAPSAASAPPSEVAVFAEVEVDTETGVVRPVKIAAVAAGEPPSDARPAEAQIEGAVAAALERALAVASTVSAEGHPLAPPLRSWPFVTASDVPPISATFLPVDEPSTRFGSQALGQAAYRATVAAIAGAVADATGGQVRSLPLDPGTVLGLRPSG